MKIAYRGLALGILALGVSFAATPSPADAQSTPYANSKAKAEQAVPPKAPAANKAATAAPAQTVPAVPAPKALAPDLAGECAWTGKRVVSLLARDDVDTAKRFLEFYKLFDCREGHLGPALRCVILESSNAPPEEPAAARVDRCWANVSQ